MGLLFCIVLFILFGLFLIVAGGLVLSENPGDFTSIMVILTGITTIILTVKFTRKVFSKQDDKSSSSTPSDTQKIYATLNLSRQKIDDLIKSTQDKLGTSYCSVSLFKNLRGTYEEVYLNRYESDMKDVTRLTIIIRNYNGFVMMRVPKEGKVEYTYIEYDNIKYYRQIGDLDKQMHISGGGTTGGDYNLGRAAAGYVIAGGAGAVIAGKNKVHSQPIKTTYNVTDTRQIEIDYIFKSPTRFGDKTIPFDGIYDYTDRTLQVPLRLAQAMSLPSTKEFSKVQIERQPIINVEKCLEQDYEKLDEMIEIYEEDGLEGIKEFFKEDDYLRDAYDYYKSKNFYFISSYLTDKDIYFQ